MDLPFIIEIEWLLSALVLAVTTGVGLPHGGVQLPSGHKPRMIQEKICANDFLGNYLKVS